MKRFFWQPAALLTLMCFLLGSFFACKSRTEFKADDVVGGKRTAQLMGGNAAPGDIMVVENNAEEVQEEIKQLRQQLDQEVQRLDARIDAEELARKAGDQALTELVQALDSRITRLEIEIPKDLERLQMQIDSNKDAIAAEEDARQKLEEKMEASDAELRKMFEAGLDKAYEKIGAVDLKVVELRGNFEQFKEDYRVARAELKTTIFAKITAVSEETQAAITNLSANLNSQINGVNERAKLKEDELEARMEAHRQQYAIKLGQMESGSELGRAIEAVYHEFTSDSASVRGNYSMSESDKSRRLEELKGRYEANVAKIENDAATRDQESLASVTQAKAELESQLDSASDEQREALEIQISRLTRSLNSSNVAIVATIKSAQAEQIAAFEETIAEREALRAETASKISAFRDDFNVEKAAREQADENFNDELNVKILGLHKDMAAAEARAEQGDAELHNQIATLKEDIRVKTDDLNFAITTGNAELAEKIASEADVLKTTLESNVKSLTAQQQEDTILANARMNLLQDEMLKNHEIILQKHEVDINKLIVDVKDNQAKMQSNYDELSGRVDQVAGDLAALDARFGNNVLLMKAEVARLEAKGDAASEAQKTALAALKQNMDAKFGQMQSEFNGKIAEVQSQMATANAEMTVALAEQKESLTFQLTTLQKVQNAQGEQLEATKAELQAELDAAHTNLQIQINATNSEMDHNKRMAASALTTKVAYLEGLVASTTQQQADAMRSEFNAKIKANTAAIENLQEYVETNFATKAELSMVQESVEALKGVTDVLRTDLDGLESEFDSFAEETKAEMKSMNGAIDTLGSELSDLSDDVSTLEGNFSSYQTKMAGALSNLNSKINKAAAEAHFAAQTAIQNARNASREAAGQEAMRKSLASLKTNFTVFQTYTNGSLKNLAKGQKTLGEKYNNVASAQADLAQSQKAMGDALATEKKHRIALEKDALEVGMILDEIREKGLNASIMAQAKGDVAQMNANLEAKMKEVTDQLGADIKTVQANLDAYKLSMKDQLKAVADSAAKLVADLDKKTGDRFVTMAQDIATLQHDQNLMKDDIKSNTEGVLKNAKNLKDFMTEQVAINEIILGLLTGVVDSVGSIQKRVIDAIDPILQESNLDRQWFSNDFKTATNAACTDFVDPNDEVGKVLGMEWFFYVASSYLHQVGLGFGKEFVKGMGLPFPISNKEATSLLLTKVLNPLPSGENLQALPAKCVDAVNGWSNKVLLGDVRYSMTHSKNKYTKQLHDALVAAKMKEVLKPLADNIQKLSTPVNNLVAGITEKLKDEGNSAAQIEVILRKGDPNGKAPYLANVFNTLYQRINTAKKISGNQGEIEAMTKIAKEVRTQKTLMENNKKAIADLTADQKKKWEENEKKMVAEKNRLDGAIAKVGALEGKVAKLETAQQKAFELIARMAGKLGFKDILEEAVVATQKIGGNLNAMLGAVAKINSVNHYYNHYTNRYGQRGGCRCNSRQSTPGNLLNNWQLTQCAVHGTYTGTRWHGAYTWGNFWSTPGFTNGWRYYCNKSCGGHIVRNGVFMNSKLDITNVNTRKDLINLANNPGVGNTRGVFTLKIVGTAEKFKITAMNEYRKNNRTGAATQFDYTVTLNAADFRVPGTTNVFHVPFPKAISALGGCTWNRRITVEAQGITGPGDPRPATSTIVHRFHQFSPVVFDFENTGMVQTTNPIESDVHFDLDGNGVSEQTGWLTGKVGFLALDRNNNGKIDDGTELFGEATALQSGEKASNGYQALTELDSNKDGIIDQQDDVFNKLVVWFDANKDGKSQAYEMRSLSSLAVTKFSVNYTNVPKDQVVQHHGLNESNLVKYQAKFWGPKVCGKDGCNSYDVFFGTVEQTRFAIK